MVAPGCMDEMVASFTVGIPIATYGDDHQLGISDFGADSWRDWSAVQRVEHIPPRIVRQLSRLPDTRDQKYTVGLNLQVNQ
jgi:hypothetical protein